MIHKAISLLNVLLKMDYKIFTYSSKTGSLMTLMRYLVKCKNNEKCIIH